MSIRIKNWDEFQHYKDRNPPWIKLHRRLLNDRQFFSLDGDCVKTLVLLWMLAADTKDGTLPPIEDIAFRLRLDSGLLACQISKLNHWVILDDSDMLADRYHGAIPETETETERESETKTEAKTKYRAIALDTDFDAFWNSYPKKVGKKAADKAFQTARKSGCPSIHVIIAAIEKQRKSDQWRRDGGKFIPNPATWLNQGRWDDEVKTGDPALAGIMEWYNSEEDNEQESNWGMFGADDEKLSRAVPIGHGNVGGVGEDDG
jgi:hypothetical protein